MRQFCLQYVFLYFNTLSFLYLDLFLLDSISFFKKIYYVLRVPNIHCPVNFHMIKKNLLRKNPTTKKLLFQQIFLFNVYYGILNKKKFNIKRETKLMSQKTISIF
ncbi:hypothetical protein EDEG_03288 [Edhazardia aedis USNM 41457]|uniref:Transmembrane protein n=1 Tax=Edhazardia aedis (strain USNM 41457) TaxID=1003232 RepID=J9DLN7_EDHAE|nr:hypothetical protein EDEG_03288 [Edhazardia aedis USNM 41457]|eukprot:EJW02282.1 hypothetical protein EDEG_03288 [Edhazardia aedis USNM 41457]